MRLGANEVIISTDAGEMKKHAGSFDFILNTISADHDINAYIQMLGLTATSLWSERQSRRFRCRPSPCSLAAKVSPVR